MRYWSVNQNQTYQHEVWGGYLWSPKRRSDGSQDPFYDFANTLIKALGIAQSHAYEAPKPKEFGQTGAYWDQIGGRVDVGFVELRLPIRPSERMDVLAPLLPTKYSPLRSNGTGLQSLYLTQLPELLAGTLFDLIGVDARNIIRGHVFAERQAITHAEFLGANRDRLPDLNDASMEDMAEHMRSYDAVQMAGVINEVKGKLFERPVVHYENTDDDGGSP